MDHRIGDNQARIGHNLIEAVHLASPIPLWTITNSAEKWQKKPQTAVRTRNWPLQVNWLLQESPVPSRQMCDCIFSAKESLHFNMWTLGNRLILRWGQCKKKKGQPKKTTKAFMVYILSRNVRALSVLPVDHGIIQLGPLLSLLAGENSVDIRGAKATALSFVSLRW